jgi:hypothetical protein
MRCFGFAIPAIQSAALRPKSQVNARVAKPAWIGVIASAVNATSASAARSARGLMPEKKGGGVISSVN